MVNIGDKVHYAGPERERILRGDVTAVHSDTCVNLRVRPPKDSGAPEFDASSVPFSGEPKAFHWGKWNEAQIKAWEQPESMRGPLTSADVRSQTPAPRALPPPVVVEQETAPQSDPVVVTAGSDAPAAEAALGDEETAPTA